MRPEYGEVCVSHKCAQPCPPQTIQEIPEEGILKITGFISITVMFLGLFLFAFWFGGFLDHIYAWVFFCNHKT